MATKKIVIEREEELQRRFMRQLYILLGFGCLLYYVFPCVLRFTMYNSEALTAVMWTLLIGVYPFYPFIGAFLNTRYHGFRFYIPIILGGYFVPAAVIFFGFSALPFVIVYILFGYFGALGGYMTLKRIDRQRRKKEKALHEERKATGRCRRKKS